MSTSQRIVPHIWFDKEAVQAAEFYVSVFPASQITNKTILRDTPSGDCDVVSFALAGYAFQAISAGPAFKVNPSISFAVNCATAGEVDALWAKLADGGQALMPLDAYPFNPRFGWVQDRFGVSWQLAVSEAETPGKPSITPSLLFVGANCGKAEEAIHFYTAVFQDSAAGHMLRYGPDQAPDQEGTVMHADFVLESQRFAIGDSAWPHEFAFNEAISFIVNCENQAEIDAYWGRLSAVPEAEQCGWLKDRYGLSWQIVPAAMEEMMLTGSPEQIARITQAFLPMKKLDLAIVKRAYEAA
ncbi:MAG: VOC family protein [Pirellulaceae bacterium]|nr:VOC family protein [Pirellulaceae bacterium]